VEEMVAPDAEPVAVAGDDEDLEVRSRQLEPGGQRGRAPVDGVEPVGVHVVREPAGAADARDEHDIFLGMPSSGIAFCTALRMA
jgi:hypothetical protein